jgi:uncharacterized protein involved in copper resistance
MRLAISGSLALAACMLALAGSAAAADPPSAQGAPAATKTATSDNLDKIVCKSEQVVGSRIPGRKVCHTQRDWNQMQEDSRRNTDDSQNRGDQMTPLKGG